VTANGPNSDRMLTSQHAGETDLCMREH
jgi:hypothetical protein